PVHFESRIPTPESRQVPVQLTFKAKSTDSKGVGIRPYVCLAMLVCVAQGSAQAPAVQPPLRPLAVTQLDDRQPGSALDNARVIKLSAPEPTPITEMLLLLVQD